MMSAELQFSFHIKFKLKFQFGQLMEQELFLTFK